MTINAKILAPSDREEWLEQRRRVVGASEIAVLFDKSPWVSPFKLSAIKGGLIEDDDENQNMRWGRLLEPIAVQLIKEEHPDWTVQYNTLPNLQYFVDPANRIGATPDAFVKIPGREGRGIIQIKSVDQSSFRKRWLQNGGDIVPPIYVALQAAIECAITNSQYALVAALVIREDLHLEEVPLTPGLYAAAAARSLAFWEKVDRGETYAPDFEKDGDLIRNIYADASDGKEIDLSGDNEILELAENDRVLMGVESEATAARKIIKNKLKFKMKDANVALFRGDVIATATTVHRKPTAATTYRQFKFKENKQ